MPGKRAVPTVTGRARRWRRGKSTCTLSVWAWKAAKRSVIRRNFWRTAAKCSRPFLSPKSARLLEQSSLRKKVENFSYCFEESIFPVGAEDMMAVLDLLQGGVELA